MKLCVFDKENKIKESVFEKIWRIILESFDDDEIRSYAEMKELLNNPYFQIVSIVDGNELVGCMFIWKLDTFIFIENFAVKPDKRNSGIGHLALQYIKEYYHLPIVLEAELAESEIQKRRLNFYMRNGFNINEYHYVMPALKKDSNPLRLLILSYPNLLNEEQFEDIKNKIYSIIYDGKNL